MEFQTPFDKSPTQKAMNKIDAQEWNVISNIDRKLFKMQKGESSDKVFWHWKIIDSDVSPGSVLGQQVFLIFINGLDTGMQRKRTLYCAYILDSNRGC